MLFNRSASGLVVPQHLNEDKSAPVSFVRNLQQRFGRDMHVEWNPRKERWVIEVCSRHCGSDQPNEEGIVVHNHLCQRYYAWLVRDEETDEYMPLCDRVLEKLAEKDTSRKYGVGEDALRRFQEESARFDKEQEQKKREHAREALRLNSKDNKRQWQWIRDMFHRHDMRPNK